MKKCILFLLCIFAFNSINGQSWQTLFYDDFNRADGALGSNYILLPSGGITQLGIINNEVKIANGETSPAYWIISYINRVNADIIRISCKYKNPTSCLGFSIYAKDDGVNTYHASLGPSIDTISINRSDWFGNSTKLAVAKANYDVSKTYFMEFTLKNADLSFRFVEIGMTDTIIINTTDNVLSGNKIHLSSYYNLPNMSAYIDDFKIESYNNSTGIENIKKTSYSISPNPASNLVSVNSNGEGVLTIYNATGVVVKNEQLTQNQHQVNVADLSNGFYFITIKSKDTTKTEKLVIKR